MFGFPDPLEKTQSREGSDKGSIRDPSTVFAWQLQGRVFKCARLKEIPGILFILKIRSQKS